MKKALVTVLKGIAVFGLVNNCIYGAASLLEDNSEIVLKHAKGGPVNDMDNFKIVFRPGAILAIDHFKNALKNFKEYVELP